MQLSQEDLGRLATLVGGRVKKLKNGLEKFAGNFDEEKGANMRRSFAAYSDLHKRLQDAQENHSHSAGRNPA